MPYQFKINNYYKISDYDKKHRCDSCKTYVYFFLYKGNNYDLCINCIKNENVYIRNDTGLIYSEYNLLDNDLYMEIYDKYLKKYTEVQQNKSEDEEKIFKKITRIDLIGDLRLCCINSYKMSDDDDNTEMCELCFKNITFMEPCYKSDDDYCCVNCYENGPPSYKYYDKNLYYDENKDEEDEDDDEFLEFTQTSIDVKTFNYEDEDYGDNEQYIYSKFRRNSSYYRNDYGIGSLYDYAIMYRDEDYNMILCNLNKKSNYYKDIIFIILDNHGRCGVFTTSYTYDNLDYLIGLNLTKNVERMGYKVYYG